MKKILIVFVALVICSTLLLVLSCQKKFSIINNESKSFPPYKTRFLTDNIFQLTDNSEINDVEPSILQIEDGDIWLVWRNENNHQIYNKVSADNGKSWSAPFLLSEKWDNLSPCITQTTDGKIWVVWVAADSGMQYDVFYKTTLNKGQNWSPIKKIETPETHITHPSILETRDGMVWILWGNHYVTSSDKGNSWSQIMTFRAPFMIHPTITQTFDKELLRVGWADSQIVFCVSENNGKTWSDKVNLADASGLRIAPQIRQSSDGKIWITWHSNHEGNEDIYYITSKDNGITWSTPYKITADSTSDVGSDIAEINDKIEIVWSSNREGEYEIYGQTIADVEISLGAISGVVADPQNNPISVATLEVLQNGQLKKKENVESDGTYLFYLKPGIYVVRASAEGYQTKFHFLNGLSDVVIEEKQTTSNINFNLLPIGARGGKIAFVSERDGSENIYIMNADGTYQFRLTQNGGSFPSIYPDGNMIVFTSDYQGNSEIYLMNTKGSNLVNLTNSPGNDKFPSFSPDGSKIAFVSDRDGNEEIYTMDIDGNDQIRLTFNSMNDDIPRFTPDGKKIVFRSTTDGQLYIMNIDGTNQAKLTENLNFDKGYAISPDGSILAFSDTEDIYSIYLAGTSISSFLVLARDRAFPCFSPDGKHVAFSSAFKSKSEIYTMNVDSTNKVKRTENRYRDFGPTWGPGEMEDLSPPLAFNLVAPKNNTWTSDIIPKFKWQRSSDPESGISGYSVYVNDLKMDIFKDNDQAQWNEPLTTGTYNWYVTAKNEYNLTTRSNQTFSLNIIPPIEIVPIYLDEQGKARIARGGKATYYVYINNINTIPVTFNLDISDNLKKPGIHAFLSPSTISLIPGEIGKAELTIAVDKTYPMRASVTSIFFNVFTKGNDVKRLDEELVIEKVPIIHNLQPINSWKYSSKNVTFSWHTNIEATSTIFLRAEDESNYKKYSGKPGKLHTVAVSELTRNKKYYFKAESRSAADTFITPQERAFYITNGIIFTNDIYDFKIKRDYNQNQTTDGRPIIIRVINTDTKPHNLLLEIENRYHDDDIVLGFIGEGSQDKIIKLAPGSSKNVPLVIHAQDVKISGTKPYEEYSFIAKLTSEDEGDTIRANARVNIHVKVPYINYKVTPIHSRYPSQFLTKRYRVTNARNGDKITDLTLHFSSKLKSTLVFEPNIENVSLAPGQSIEFEAIPSLLHFLENPSAPTSGKFILQAANMKKSVQADFGCPAGKSLWRVTLDNVLFTSKTAGGWCTNSCPIDIIFKLPSGIDWKSIKKINISMIFTPQSNDIRPHDVKIFLNDHKIGTLTNTVPSGVYTFDVDVKYLNTTDIGLATNTIRLESTMNRGSYLPVSNIDTWIAINKVEAIVCAANEQEAQEIARQGVFKPEPASYNAVIKKPAADEELIIIGRSDTIEVELESPIPDFYVKAAFSNGDDAILLSSTDNGKTYKGIWTPLNEGDKNGNCRITVSVGACGNGKAERWVKLISPPDKILQVPYCYQGNTNWYFLNALTMVLQYYGKKVHPWDIAKEWDFGHDEGFSRKITNPLEWNADVFDYVNRVWGLTIEEKSPNLKNFNYYKKWIEKNQPVILTGHDYKDGRKDGHAVVIVGYEEKDEDRYLYVHDPSGHFTETNWKLSQFPHAFVKVPFDELMELLNIFGFVECRSWVITNGSLSPSKGTMFVTDKKLDFFNKNEPHLYLYLDGKTDHGYKFVEADSKGELIPEVALNPSKNHNLMLRGYISNHTLTDQKYKIFAVVHKSGEDISGQQNLASEDVFTVPSLVTKTITEQLFVSAHSLSQCKPGDYCLFVFLRDLDNKILDETKFKFKLISQDEAIARNYLPNIFQASIDKLLENNLEKIGYSVKKKSSSIAEIEYNFVFEDEDFPLPNIIVDTPTILPGIHINIDKAYDDFREQIGTPGGVRRLEDIEKFIVGVDLANGEIISMGFPKTWGGQLDYLNLWGEHFRKNFNKEEINLLKKGENDRINLYISTWNHLFSNEIPRFSKIDLIPIRKKIEMDKLYFDSKIEFVNKTRKELDSAYPESIFPGEKIADMQNEIFALFKNFEIQSADILFRAIVSTVEKYGKEALAGQVDKVAAGTGMVYISFKSTSDELGDDKFIVRVWDSKDNAAVTEAKITFCYYDQKDEVLFDEWQGVTNDEGKVINNTIPKPSNENYITIEYKGVMRKIKLDKSWRNILVCIDPSSKDESIIAIISGEGGIASMSDGTKIDIPPVSNDLMVKMACVVSKRKQGIYQKANRAADQSLHLMQLTNASTVREITAIDIKDNTKFTDFDHPATVTIPYPDKDNDGIVDGNNFQENMLRMFCLNEKAEQWQEIPGSMVNTYKNNVSVKVNHLSTFCLMGVCGEALILADQGGEVYLKDGTRIEIPANVLAADAHVNITASEIDSLSITTATKKITQDPSLKLYPLENSYRKFTAIDVKIAHKWRHLQRYVLITLPYLDSDQNNIVDKTEFKENSLELFHLNEETLEWQPVKKFQVFPENNIVIGEVDKFGTFVLMAPAR